MFNILHSYWLRTKRTPARWVLLLCPFFFTTIFMVYLSVSSGLKGFEVSSFFEAYTILAYFSISFFIPMLYESDKNACMYANDVRCGIDRKKLFFARFVFIFILLVVIELIAVIPFWLFLKLTGITISRTRFVLCVLICSLTLQTMIPIYQFLSIKFNYTGSILAGIFFTLATILLGTTSLGDAIWYFLPFVYPVKFLLGYLQGLFTLNDMFILLFLSIFIAMFSVLLFALWYNKWDGISKMEE